MRRTEAATRGGSTRATPVVLLAVAGVLLLARIGLGMWGRPEPVDLVDWREPGAAATAEARSTGKPILYDFSADWCGPCRMMQKDVFADPTMAAQINAAFVPVRVLDRQQEEGRNSPEVDALQKAYGVQSFPTLVASSPGGARHVSLEGYPGGPATMDWLGKAANLDEPPAPR